MLDQNSVDAVIARLRNEGWHYERDLFALVAPHNLADVLQTLQVLLAARVIRAQGEGERKRYKWI